MNKVISNYMDAYEKILPIKKRKNLFFIDFFGIAHN